MITLSYHFPKWDRPVGSIRLGNITMMPKMFDKNIKLTSINDEGHTEIFALDSMVSQHMPSSTLVSSSGAFEATTGNILIECNQNQIELEWNTSDCAVMPLLQHDPTLTNSLTRIFFSMLEVDDTSKNSGHIGSFDFSIYPVK